VDRVTEARQQFAMDLARRLELRSSELVRAFATVPREGFVDEGPWLVSGGGGEGYRRTLDADPAQLYADVMVALDPERELNNGNPLNHARWLNRLGVKAGDRVVHVGAGTGYYTAILAEIVGKTGAVIAAEVDPVLLPQLRKNTASLPQIQVVEPRGVEIEFESADRIYVNCALTRPPRSWLQRLREHGTMLFPLTEMGPRRHGGVFWVQRRPTGSHAAEFVGPIRMFLCEGGRHPADEELISAAFERGGEEKVRSLRSDEHALEQDCWLHAESFCLSLRSV
jgi:protein-L-isoaspartate(D-aspartate) O-methyltransferase